MAASQPWHLVQEGNYSSHTRHIWQGGTLKISAQVIRITMSAERDHPPIGSWGDCPLGIRVAKTFIEKTQKGGVHHSQGITEAGSRPLMRQPSSAPHRAAPCHSDFPSIGISHQRLGLLDSLRLPGCPPGSRDPSLQDADESLAHHAHSRTCRPRLWCSGSLSPIDCSVCVCVCVCYIPLRLVERE